MTSTGFEAITSAMWVQCSLPTEPCSHSFSRVFFEEFGNFLESNILCPESLIFVGDFNFHMDVPSDPDACTFLDLLTSMGLKQHVSVPTHISGVTRSI